MSSIRLFILDSLARHGAMHGHQIRLQAEKEHVHLWTDISVSSLYQVMKRMATEELLSVSRGEREGSYPERLVYDVTERGREALRVFHRQGLRDVWMKPDPFDLALARLDRDALDEVPVLLRARLAELESTLVANAEVNVRAQSALSLGEQHALSHTDARLRAEIQWLKGVIDALPAIIADSLQHNHQ